MDNLPLFFLIATGSNISILNKHVLNQLSSEVHQSVQPTRTKLSVTREITPFLGKAVVNIEIGSQTLTQKFLFADIENEGILGMDFLTAHQYDLMLTQSYLKIKREKIRCFANSRNAQPTCLVAISELFTIPPETEGFTTSRNAQPTCCWVAILEHFTIPPETVMLVEGLTTNVIDRHSTGLIEVDTEFLNKEGLLVAKALVCPSDETF